MKYNVSCTMIYNGNMCIEANSNEEAVNKAQQMLIDDYNACDWEFGEATADYAEKTEY